jgi:hypothetical protein
MSLGIATEHIIQIMKANSINEVFKVTKIALEKLFDVS